MLYYNWTGFLTSEINLKGHSNRKRLFSLLVMSWQYCTIDVSSAMPGWVGGPLLVLL